MAIQKDNGRTSKEQTSLYNELKRLAKRANQRILRLERLTGKTGTFATKQLYDYLDSDVLNALTSKGRVAVRRDFDETQMKAIIKAVNIFLENDSTVKKVKKIVKEYSKQAGKELNFEMANTYYQAHKGYDWIYKYIAPSDFWEIARECVKENWSEETFVDNISVYITDRTVDEILKEDLRKLYNYIQGVQV